MTTNSQREKKIRKSIKVMVEDGLSPESIVFAHGQIVTPDERDYLLEYEKKTHPPTDTAPFEMIGKIEELRAKSVNLYNKMGEKYVKDYKPLEIEIKTNKKRTK